MSRVLLEDTFDFKPDRAKITEAKDPTTGLVTRQIPGTLSVCDLVNGNKRRYARSVWEKNLAEGAPFATMLRRRSSFGLLEHPADGKVDLRSPISHITTDAKLVEREVEGKKTWVVEGVITLVETPEGQKLAALINCGYDPLVSSRGYGTLVKASDGVDDVQEDFVCEGWDAVSLPSFSQAQLTPERPKKEESLKSIESKLLTVESQSQSLKVDNLRVIGLKRLPEGIEVTLEDGSVLSPTPRTSQPPLAPTQSSVKASQHQTSNKKMDISKIRESMQSLKAVNPATLTARSFAQGFAQMSELHNAAAKILSEDSTASWSVDQLHKEISGIEEAWVAAYESPRAEVKKLGENQTKLLRVLKKVTEHAVKVRGNLDESVKKSTKATEITETVAQRGRAWMDTARTESGNRRLNEKKYNLACEALDIMADRYKTDVAELGARVIELEFPSMTEEQKKALGQARTPKAVIAVREAIEGDKAKDKPAKVEESKAKETKQPEAKPAAPALPTVAETQIFRTDVAAVGFSESVSMVRRLSNNRSQFHS